MSQLNNLLDGLGSDGTLESTGSFTIDLDKAGEKLEQYRLPSPHHYILSLVSAANGSGATRIRIRRNLGQCRVSFDGDQFQKDDLRRLFEGMLLGKLEPMKNLTEIGLAVGGARNLSPLVLEMKTGDKDNAVQVCLEEHSIVINDLKKVPINLTLPDTSTEFRVVERWSLFDTLSAMVLGLRRREEELELLKRHARYSYADIIVNEKRLNTNRLGPWPVAAEVAGFPRSRKLTISSDCFFQFQGDRTFGGYIGFGLQTGGWMFIVNGLAFQKSTEHSEFPNSRAVIYCDDLKKDLSGNGLVEDERFSSLVKKVDQKLRQLRSKAKKHAQIHPMGEQLKSILKTTP